jgi:tripartite-type tricarboxylate transporter receptor subunit TctC
LPTVAAAGVPGYESVSHVGLFAPAQTPAAVVQRLNRETVAALRRPEVREQIANAAAEAIGSSPEEFAEAIRQETARWTQVIKDTGMRAQ